MNRQLPNRIPTLGDDHPELARSSESARARLAAVMLERFGDDWVDTVSFTNEPEPDTDSPQGHG